MRNTLELLIVSAIGGTSPVVDPSDPQNKPTLTPEQEARVREIYADDIALWESLP